MEVKLLKSASSFIENLDLRGRLKARRLIKRLKSEGNTLSLPTSKSLGQGLFELRLLSTIQIRLFYCFHNNSAYILHGIVKKDQKIPKKEIDYARKIRNLLLTDNI